MAQGPVTTVQMVAPGTQLSNAVQTLYTVPAKVRTQIKAFTVKNTDTVVHLVTIWLGGITDAFIIFKENVQAGSEAIIYPALNQVMDESQSLNGAADLANKVNVFASGTEVVK